MPVSLDQPYITAQAHESLVDLARRTSGMISNFISRLQGSDYRGEKFNRPQRHAREAATKWMTAGQAAQLANIRTQALHYQQQQSCPSPSSPPPASSDPSHPSNV